MSIRKRRYPVAVFDCRAEHFTLTGDAPYSIPAYSPRQRVAKTDVMPASAGEVCLIVASLGRVKQYEAGGEVFAERRTTIDHKTGWLIGRNGYAGVQITAVASFLGVDSRRADPVFKAGTEVGTRLSGHREHVGVGEHPIHPSVGGVSAAVR